VLSNVDNALWRPLLTVASTSLPFSLFPEHWAHFASGLTRRSTRRSSRDNGCKLATSWYYWYIKAQKASFSQRGT